MQTEIETLTFSAHTVWFAGFLALLLVLTGAVWGALTLMSTEKRERFTQAIGKEWLDLIYVIVGIFFLVALGATATVLFDTIRGALAPIGSATSPNLGAGALIAAILGSPFVIWATVLKHRTLAYQTDSAITDRISKAVEQLGADKEVSRPMRNVTYTLGGDTFSVFEGRDDVADIPTDATDIVRGEWNIVQRTVPNIEVRIGAILSLERIAQDSTAHDHGRDHVRVMEILCAYVRENAPASGARDHEFGEWEPLKDGATVEERETRQKNRVVRLMSLLIEGLERQWSRSIPPPRADIAIALQVLGRRSQGQRHVEAAWPTAPDASTHWVFDTPCPDLADDPREATQSPDALDDFLEELKKWKYRIEDYPGYRLDLRNTNLQGADLSGLVLSGARLNEVRLEGANLEQTKMAGTILRRARMAGANLLKARLEATDLFEARLEAANLLVTRLDGADLRKARMEGAYFTGTSMNGAGIIDAQMAGADFLVARMEGAILDGARMDRAFLMGARMDARTSMEGVNLLNAAARDLDLSSVPILPDQITSMFGDASVILPMGIARPSHWPTFDLDPETFGTEYQEWLADPDAYTPPPPPSP
jgi:hypothetical protein